MVQSVKTLLCIIERITVIKMDNTHNITIIGSTGSIGTQTLEVADNCKNIKIHGLSSNTNIELLEQQIRKYKPEIACVVSEEKAKELKIKTADVDTKIVTGIDGLCEVASVKEADTVVTAVVGISGLLPTIHAIKSKKNIALANKETLVCGGHIISRLCKEYGVSLLPVDSEHSAIFQSMQGFNRDDVKRILLTASGGPFYGKKKNDLENIKPGDALKHPNWNMGAKVTIDSSTLVNKGLEVIEAKWLFGTDAEKIKVLIHRQSIIHSMVEYKDNGIIAQLGYPDMKLPIQYAIEYPKRLPMNGNEIDFATFNTLTFDEPDTETFNALKLAYRAAKDSSTMATVFNSADEAAVELFLNGKIKYLEISELIEKAMNNIIPVQNPDIDEIFNTDIAAREYVYNEQLKK